MSQQLSYLGTSCPKKVQLKPGTYFETNECLDVGFDLFAAFASPTVPGPFKNDAEAAAAGVPVRGMYTASSDNDYEIPSAEGRTVIVRLA